MINLKIRDKHMLPSLSIAIASYNDAKMLRTVIEHSAVVASQLAKRFRILVVDDGSSDESKSVLSQLVLDYDWLECRFHPHNLGFGETFRELYSYDQCEYNAILPGDGQISPNQIEFLAQHIGEADIVLGRRKVRCDSLSRRINSSVYNSVISLVAGRVVSDANSISLARTSPVRKMLLTSSSAFIHAEFLLEGYRHGARIAQIDIDHEPRRHGKGQGGKPAVIASTISELFQYLWERGFPWIRRNEPQYFQIQDQHQTEESAIVAKASSK